MQPFDENELINNAVRILKDNDRGSYTVPTDNLYPFQWNWDSCLTALGQSYFDEGRAWREIQTLFEHQWEDGMVPHIVFHARDDGYFPGPDVWSTNRPTPTSGITQPPVAGFAVHTLFQRCENREQAEAAATGLLPAVSRWHEWFYMHRDPDNTGLVAILHPWESGRDNSADWDAALDRVPTEGVMSYHRRDTDHTDSSHRPTKAQYDRYIALVQQFRTLYWNNSVLHDASPFKVVDPGFNAILIRSCSVLAELAKELGLDEIAEQNRQWAERGRNALDTLWQESAGQYACMDRVTGTLIPSLTVGGLLPVFAGPLPHQRQDALIERLAHLMTRCKHPIPSHDPDDKDFDSLRYWRGPSWLIINYMIVDGLQCAGAHDLATALVNASLNTVQTQGFAEYYDPLDGTPCGGSRFTWTAAMVLEFLGLMQQRRVAV